MSDLFAQDLARWERGELSMAALGACHPAEEVRELTDLWVRLSEAGREPVPDVERGWAAVAARLQDRRQEKTAAGWRVRRRAVAVLAAALLSIGSAAYAVGPGEIRDAVNGAVSRIADLFRGGPPGHHRAPPPAPSPSKPATAPTPDSGSHPMLGPSARPPEPPQDRLPVFKLKRERPGEGMGGEGHGQTEPTAKPTTEPSEEPSPEPSEEPSPDPSPEPSPSAEPSPPAEPSPSPSG